MSQPTLIAEHDAPAAWSPPTATVLLTELVGSAALRLRIGEEAAWVVVSEHDDLQRAIVLAHGGTAVEGCGGRLVATFRSVDDARSAAVAVQRAVQHRNRRHRVPLLSVRVCVRASAVLVAHDGRTGQVVGAS